MKNCTGIFCPMQYGKVDPATCQAADSCSHATLPKTKADIIRAMTDEELADYLRYYSDSYARYDMDWLDWLRQEAET